MPFNPLLIIGLLTLPLFVSCSSANDTTSEPSDLSQPNAQIADSSTNTPDSALPTPDPTSPDSDANASVSPNPDDSVIDPPASDNPETPSLNDATPPQNQDTSASGNSLLFPDDTSPLSDEARQALAAIKWDMAPEVLNAVLKENEGGHFPWSDELHPDRFHDYIHNLGGTYIGVGTDQTYVFISWQRPTLAFAVDYDPWVVYIHHGYIALFDTCDNIDCFKKMLEDKSGTYKFLLNYYADNPDRVQIAKIFRANAHGILRQFKRIATLPYPTFVNDTDSYNYIRTLVKSGRLVTLQANLLGDVALNSISQTLRDAGRTVTALYTSNAEQYWSYGKQFKENMRSIPWADNGFVMRTMATKVINKDYTYRIMPYKVFMAWLDDPSGKDVRHISQRYRFAPRAEDSTDPPEVPFILDDVMPQNAPQN